MSDCEGEGWPQPPLWARGSPCRGMVQAAQPGAVSVCVCVCTRVGVRVQGLTGPSSSLQPGNRDPETAEWRHPSV